MSYYTTKQIVYFYGSAPAVDAALLYNSTDVALTGAKMDFFISASSEYVDNFLRPAGYQVPLASVSPVIQEVVSYLVLERLYTHTQQDIPDSLKRATQSAKSTLLGLQEKTISLAGLDQNPAIGTGGHVASSTSTYSRFFDRKSWGKGSL